MFEGCNFTDNISVLLLVTIAIWFSFEALIVLIDGKKAFKVDSRNTRALFCFILASIAAIVISAKLKDIYIVDDKILHIKGGLILMWLGIILRLWAVYSLGSGFSPVIKRNDQDLVKSGPYRFVRHPSYAGAIIIFSGLALALGNVLSISAAVMIISIGYYQRINSEEKHLLSSLGETYSDYIKTTKKLIPFVY